MLKNFRGLTLSGPDTQTDFKELVELQRERPWLEFGVLWSLSRAGQPRYPDHQWVESASVYGLNFALHLCGKVARDMVEQGITPEIPGIPGRIQINCNGMTGRKDWWRTLGVMRWGLKVHTEFIIQVCDPLGAYWVGLMQASGLNVAPLFDDSGGRGITLEDFPRPLQTEWCGYAGGIGKVNIDHVAKHIKGSGNFWLDMESSLRTDDQFDMEKVRSILAIVDRLVFEGDSDAAG